MFRSLYSCAFRSAALFVVCALPLGAFGAPILSSSSVLPSPDAVLIRESPTLVTFPSGVAISDLRLSNPTGGASPSGSLGVAVDSFFDIEYEIDLGGGGGGGGATGTASGAMRAANIGSSGQDGYFDTEMLALSLVGLPGGLMIRESPSRPSMGQTAIRNLGPGGPGPVCDPCTIDSFFDVFTELSIDGGQTWEQASGPLRLTSAAIPEPSIALLLAPPAAALFALRRRTSRRS